jgi:hypothetical protein
MAQRQQAIMQLLHHRIIIKPLLYLSALRSGYFAIQIGTQKLEAIALKILGHVRWKTIGQIVGGFGWPTILFIVKISTHYAPLVQFKRMDSSESEPVITPRKGGLN